MNYQETINFIKNLYCTDDFLPLHPPIFLGNEKKYLNDCIDSTYVSSVGKYVDIFEEMVANYTGSTKAVACVNGTSALYIALKLVGVEHGDEIITQSLSFIATANAISYCDANPVFLDVDIDTMGLSPVAVRKWLIENALVSNNTCINKKTGNRIKACVPMNTFGHPVHIEDLVKLCKEYSIELVEDSAESLGSFYKGKHTGTFGKVGVLSFNGNKTITTGGGGMLLFKDNELAAYAKHITTQAKISHRWEFKHDSIGYNLRMPNLNAALGCAQLENINEILNNKRETSLRYKKYFDTIDFIEFFNEPNNCKSNFWFNAILLDNKEERNCFLEQTNNKGIMTRPIWELMSNLEMYKNFHCDELINSKMFVSRVVNIPSGYRR